MRGKLGLVSIMLLAALLLLGGCGDADEAEAPEEEPAEEEVAVEEEEEVEEEAAEEPEDEADDEDAVYFESDDYALPETFAEFIATFKEIQYTGGEVDGEQTTIGYEHLGVEEVDGVEADKVEFSVEGVGFFTLWVDSDGNFQRVIVDGEEIPVEIAQSSAEQIKNAALAPFHHITGRDIENIFSADVPGYEQNLVGTETKTYGDQSVKVYSVEISVEPPAVEEEYSSAAIADIAEFDDFQVVTYWETTEPVEGGGKGFLEIDELVLR